MRVLLAAHASVGHTNALRSIGVDGTARTVEALRALAGREMRPGAP